LDGLFFFYLLIYLMFFTKRTVLRVLGWAVCLTIVYWLLSGGDGTNAGVEATRIINDLRSLRGAAISFREDHGRPPLPGEEASLDLYLDRPLVTVEHPIYAKVMLFGGLSGDIGYSRQYIGVKLRSEINGGNEIQKEIQRKLAIRAEGAGILGEAPSGGKEMPFYKSGLNAYMEIPLK
jgi:hypothetical protein